MIIIVIILILLVCYILTYLKNRKNSNFLTEDKIKDYESQLENLEQKTMNDIKTSLEKLFYPEPIIMANEISNKKEFNNSISEVSLLAHTLEKNRNVTNIKILAHYVVKYYAPHIMKYGDVSNKAFYCKNVEILNKYKLINK